jgi:hypothetical protein
VSGMHLYKMGTILSVSGVYGMWNVYVFGLLSLYAPSHKTITVTGKCLHLTVCVRDLTQRLQSLVRFSHTIVATIGILYVTHQDGMDSTYRRNILKSFIINYYVIIICSNCAFSL